MQQISRCVPWYSPVSELRGYFCCPHGSFFNTGIVGSYIDIRILLQLRSYT